MNKSASSQIFPTALGKLTDVPSSILQRKCACGTHTVAGDKCDKCADKKGSLQRKSSKNSEQSEVPPIVYKVLNSSGQPLDAGTRAFMERRFSHDFSGVRIHTDAKAAESAIAVSALAYTVGKNIVFGSGQYQPASKSGQQLIGHELAHTIQQEYAAASQNPLSVSRSEDSQEREADRAADAVLHYDDSTFTQIEKTGAINAIGDRLSVRRGAGLMLQRRLALPIENRAPSSAMTILDFIRLVEREENRYPVSEQMNIPLMITRIRKIFYGEASWDEHLITGAASIAPPYRIESTETGRETADLPGPFNLDMVRHRVRPIDTAGHVPEIFAAQELALPDGSYIDIGHVFAGLDALNRPNQVGGHFSVNITSNAAAVTWVGDLASILGEVRFRDLASGSVSETQIQAIINEYAPPQDMLGNIEAYAMSDYYRTTNTVRIGTVSQLLREYYLGETDRARNAREHRYSTHAASIGLRGWDGTRFSNEASWIDDYTDEVNDAAALYIGVNTRGIAGYPFALRVAINQWAGVLVTLYLEELKRRITKEPSPTR